MFQCDSADALLDLSCQARCPLIQAFEREEDEGK